MPLTFPEITETNTFTNILLVSSSVRDYQVFVDSVNATTLPIVFNRDSSKTELLEVFNTHFSTISRIGLVFETTPVGAVFLDNEPFFSNGENPNTNTELLITLIKQFQIQNIDFLACSTLNMPDWKAFYDVLGQSTNVVVGASNNDTGNLQYGGDWVMESSCQDVELIYFTESIEYYKYLLGDYGQNTYAIGADGKIYGAGESGARQALTTAVGTYVNSTSYVQLTNNTGLKPVYVTTSQYGGDPSGIRTVVIMNNGAIYEIIYGVLTLIPNNTGYTPVTVGISSLNGGLTILMSNGMVYGVGDNSRGVYGNGTTTTSSSFTRMNLPNGTIAKKVVSMQEQVVVLCSDNKIYICGYLNANIIVTQGGIQSTLIEVVNSTGYIPSTFDFGNSHLIVLMTNGTIWGKGYNGDGQLGINNFTNQSSFQQMLSTNATNSNIPVGVVPKQITCGLSHTLVLMSNGIIYGTGHNWGELGTNDLTATSVSTLRAMINTTGKVPVAMAGGQYWSQVLFNDGSIYGCGNNSNGQLGVGSAGIKYVLTASNLTSNIVSITSNPYILIKSVGFPISTTQRISAPIGSLSLANGLTFSHWLKCNTSASKQQVWMLVNNNAALSNTNYILRLNWFNQNWTTEAQNGSADIVTYPPTTFSNAGFNHVVVTIVCNPVLEVRIYINGALNSVATYYNNGLYSSPLTSTSSVYLNLDAYQNTNLATYNIDDLNIFQSILNTTQITKLFTNAAKINTNGGTMTLTYPVTPSLGTVSYVSGNTAVATVSNNLLTIVAPGTSVITATQEADGIYASSTITTTLTVAGAKPILGYFTPITGTFDAGTIIITPPYTNSDGAFSYTSSNTGVATISGSNITMTGIGTTTITATLASTTNYSSGSTTTTLTVSKTNPTITSFTIPTKTLGNADFNLTAPTSNSNGAFSYISGNISIATVAGNTVSIITSGTVAITATQEASGNYFSGSITSNLVINNPPPTFGTFTVASKVFGSSSFQLSPPTSNSNGTFSYTSSNTGVATVSGTMVTIVGVGSTTITATQAVSSNYVSGSTTATFTVTATAPTINSWSLASCSVNTVINLQSFLPTSNSSGAFTFTSGNASVASISGNTLTTNSIGSTTITANQAAAGNYTSGTVSTVLTVVYSSPTISSWTIPDYNISSSNTLPNPVSNSTVPFTFTSSDSTVASITGSTISILAAGTVTLTAFQDASLNFSSASTTKTITISDSYISSSWKTNGGGSISISPKDLIFGTSDYTIEFWCYPYDSRYLIGTDGTTGTANAMYVLPNSGNNVIIGGGGGTITYTMPTSSARWKNIVLVRKFQNGSSTHACFINGVKHTSFATTGTLPLNFTGATNSIGSTQQSYGYLGLVTSVRFIIGSSYYDPNSSSLSVSYKKLTNVTDTKLLFLGDTYTDSSTAAHTLTNTNVSDGTLLKSAFPSDMSYSYYFNGSNYLTFTPDISFGVLDYTIEFWIYQIDGNGRQIIGTTGNNGLSVSTNSSTVTVDSYSWGSMNYTFSSVATGVWNNVILVRKNVAGTSTHACFLNGVKHTSFSTSYQNTLPYNFSGPTNTIGSSAFGSKAYGYIANLRIVVGTAVYDPANSTVKYPTTVLSNVANTKLLLIGSSIADKSTSARTITNNGSVSVTNGVGAVPGQ